MNLILIALVLSPVEALAAFDTHGFKHIRELKAPAVSTSGYAAVDLDPAALGSAASHLADLRLIDGQGREVPYQLTIHRGQASSDKLLALLSDLGRTDDATTFVLDTHNGYRHRSHSQLTLETPSRNFRRRVKVEASDDRQGWYVIREDAIIFDVTTDYTARHVSVDYPASTRRYLRVTILDKGAPRLVVDDVELQHEGLIGLKENAWSLVNAQRREEDRLSVWDVDMGHENVPVTRIALEVGDTNYQRYVTVVSVSTGPAGNEIRNTLASGTIWSFRTPGLNGSETAFKTGGFRSRRFRIEVHNGDNPPLGKAKLSFFGPRHTLYFPADRPRPYRLLSGNTKAKLPQYDLQAFAAYAGLDHAVLTGFAEAKPLANPEYRETDDRPYSERHPVLFWIVLGTLCAFLLYLIADKTRQLLKK